MANQGGTCAIGRTAITQTEGIATHDISTTLRIPAGSIGQTENLLTHDIGKTQALRKEGLGIARVFQTQDFWYGAKPINLFLPVYKSAPTTSVTYYRMVAFNTVTLALESWVAVGAPNSSNPSGQPITNVRVEGKWVVTS